MPPRSSILWQCAKGVKPRQHQPIILPIRTISSSPSGRQPRADTSRDAPKRISSADSSDAPHSSTPPPESPRYLFVPSPPQPDQFVPRPIKGILPQPRHPFQRKKQRASRSALAAATPEPSTTLTPPAHLSAAERARVTAKAALAAQRRALLREGTLALRTRYGREARQRAEKDAARAAAHERRLRAAEPIAERLTSPTVRTAATPPSAALQRDPAAEAAHLAARRTKYVARQAALRSRRSAALHTLYERAGSFAVDEPSLQRMVDAAFDTPFYREHPDRSVWDAEGFPESLAWLVAQETTTTAEYREALAGEMADLAAASMGGSADRVLRRTRERADRLAEVLTVDIDAENTADANSLATDADSGAAAVGTDAKPSV